MSTLVARAETPLAEARRTSLGLSGRLLLLTMLFVIVAEVIVFVPSGVAALRAWVGDRVMGAQMIALALSSGPPEAQSAELERTLLAGIRGAQAVGIRGSGTRWLLAEGDGRVPAAGREIDLRSPSWWRAAGALGRLLFVPARDVIRVIAPAIPGGTGNDWVEVLIDEAAIKAAVQDYTRGFLLVSLAVSAVTGAFLYLALHLLVVRPVQRLAGNVADFAADPEDIRRVIRPSGRTDEIGRAEEALARMETALAGELRQKRHLAELGLAVSKINHELRNMLTTAQLLGDRLVEVEDPTVRRVAPRLVRTLDRAIGFCAATLAYGRASERPPERVSVLLAPLAGELQDLAALAPDLPIRVELVIPPDLRIDADPEQLGRVLANLVRNAVEALARSRPSPAVITLTATREGRATLIRVADNGPGVPERLRDRLFSAFQASERAGGTGLGLPLAAEIVRLHGGTIRLEEGDAGARFAILIPDRNPSR